jgi:hypothetical protein
MQVSKHKQENPKNNEKNDFFWKNYMQKDYFINQTVEMHYVGHFIILLITKKLIW